MELVELVALALSGHEKLERLHAIDDLLIRLRMRTRLSTTVGLLTNGKPSTRSNSSTASVSSWAAGYVNHERALCNDDPKHESRGDRTRVPAISSTHFDSARLTASKASPSRPASALRFTYLTDDSTCPSSAAHEVVWGRS